MLAQTKKLYWHEPYRAEFEAKILDKCVFQEHPSVELDVTCFYPTSGGQPHDTGSLNGVSVVNVVEEKGRIWHLLAAPLEGSDAVRGRIAWARRFDHMQQHSGQHVLSRAFEESLDAATVSFHLGDEESTIDVDVSDLPEDQAVRVERLANTVVLDNRRVVTQQVTDKAVRKLSLRKEPQVEGPIRVVDIEGFDQCACGGTHVARTGEIGPIHIVGLQNQRGNTRVQFLCGWRALADYARKDRLVRRLGLNLSVGVDDLEDAVGRLVEAEKEARRAAEEMRTKWLDALWPKLLQEAKEVLGRKVVQRALAGHSADEMRYLAHQMTREGAIVLFGVSDPSPQICFACPQDEALNMGQILRQAAEPFGGRGGGQPYFAQGGGVAAQDLPALLERARRLLEDAIASDDGR